MPTVSPVDVVRLMFEAHATRDVRRVLRLVEPEVWATIGPGENARVEVDAHLLEADGDDGVRVFGRIRVIDGGSLTDSPAAWHVTVRGGRVVAIAPLRASSPALRRVA